MQAVQEFRAAFQAKQQDQNGGAAAELAVVDLAKTLMEKLYIAEIQKQLDMGRYKTALKTPQPLDAAVIAEGCANMATVAPTLQDSYKTTHVWKPVECVAEFAHCLAMANPETTLPAFDKS